MGFPIDLYSMGMPNCSNDILKGSWRYRDPDIPHHCHPPLAMARHRLKKLRQVVSIKEKGNKLVSIKKGNKRLGTIIDKQFVINN